MIAYQIFAVRNDGRAQALATADTATHALAKLQQAWKDHPRAWVIDANDLDVSLYELKRRAEEEQAGA